MPILPRMTSSLMAEREIAALRLIGRLGIISRTDVHTLIAPDLGRSAQYELLSRLLAQNLLWRSQAPGVRAMTPAGTVQPIRRPDVVGLTVDGLQLLEGLGVDTNRLRNNSLIARDRRAPLPNRQAIEQGVAVSSWCASLLEQIRQLPYLAALEVCVQRTVEAESLRYTPAALLSLTTARERRTAAPLWQLPWETGLPHDTRFPALRFALEIEHAPESDRRITQRANVHRVLHQAQAWRPYVGGDVTPILVVSTPHRQTQVAALWRTVWADTPALITNAADLAHETYGVLAGRYLQIATGAPSPHATIFGTHVKHLDHWRALIAEETPAPAPPSPHGR